MQPTRTIESGTLHGNHLLKKKFKKNVNYQCCVFGHNRNVNKAPISSCPGTKRHMKVCKRIENKINFNRMCKVGDDEFY